MNNLQTVADIKPQNLIEEPIYPEDWECCDNGCEELCVYEIYRVQKRAYDEQQHQLQQLAQQANLTHQKK